MDRLFFSARIMWIQSLKRASILKSLASRTQTGPDLATRISQYFRIKGVPETYFIDKNGVLKYVQIGPFTSVDAIRAQIDPLLK